MAVKKFPAKGPNEKDFRVFIWCSEDSTNDGGLDDSGELKGATISTATPSVVSSNSSSVLIESSNQNGITIEGIYYATSTTVTVWFTHGSTNIDNRIKCAITTSDGRELDEEWILPVR